MTESKYSTFWPRFRAGMIDFFILLPLGLLFQFTFAHTSSVPLRILACAVNSTIWVGYSIWMHGKYGQTLGKMICKVIVLDVSERPLTMRQAVWRDIFNVVVFPISLALDITRILHGIDISKSAENTLLDQIIGYSGLGWFLLEVGTMLLNDKRRALHDWIAGSVVIRKPEKDFLPAAAPAS